jgi:hypothetical protein
MGNGYEIVLIDTLYNFVPLLIHSVRIPCAENSTGDGGDRIAVSTDVRGEEYRVFRRLHGRGECERQRHDRQRLIRKRIAHVSRNDRGGRSFEASDAVRIPTPHVLVREHFCLLTNRITGRDALEAADNAVADGESH